MARGMATKRGDGWRAARAGLCAAFALIASQAVALEDRVVVMTSYPEEMTIRFEQAFEKLHPETRVQIVWKQGGDALAALSAPDQGGTDVYWSPAQQIYPLLNERGAFRPFPVDRAHLPGFIGAQPLVEPGSVYEAAEAAGYGLAVDPEALARAGAPKPLTWRDLTSPAYDGLLAMPVAGRVGFSPALYEIILQSEGWDAAWALLSEASANAALLTGGPAQVNAVRDGKAAIALTIDFFPLGVAANGGKLETVYPQRTAFLPAHVALMAKSPHPQAAQAFIDFTLSQEGQRLLLHPDVTRHAVRPDAYDPPQQAKVNPFATPQLTFVYDYRLARERRDLVAALFDVALVEPQPEMKALWRALQAAEARPGPAPERRRVLAQARALLGAVPVSAGEAGDPGFAGSFGKTADRAGPLDAWRDRLAANRAVVRRLIDGEPNR
jgi:phosphoglycerate transport regulatory protein PgtC